MDRQMDRWACEVGCSPQIKYKQGPKLSQRVRLPRDSLAGTHVTGAPLHGVCLICTWSSVVGAAAGPGPMVGAAAGHVSMRNSHQRSQARIDETLASALLPLRYLNV